MNEALLANELRKIADGLENGTLVGRWVLCMPFMQQTYNDVITNIPTGSRVFALAVGPNDDYNKAIIRKIEEFTK